MFRRACSWLLPALLPLALLFAVPTVGACTARVPAIERGADAGGAAVANGPLQHEQAASSWTEWIDEDGDPDRNARASVACVPVTSSVRPPCAGDFVRCTHSACAPYPRGPPSA